MSSKESQLSLEALRSRLSFEPDTGVFRWLTTQGGVTVGSPAGNLNSSGYMVVGFSGLKIRQHRLAWLFNFGAWPSGTIDHIDGDKKNNRIANLRNVPHRVNKQNMRVATASNSLGVLGVYWSERRVGYMASVSTDGKQKRKGPFSTIERAQAAYLELKRLHHEGCTL